MNKHRVVDINKIYIWPSFILVKRYFNISVL